MPLSELQNSEVKVENSVNYFFLSLHKKTMSKYKYIFFDLDRTLWDFEANSEATFKDIFSKYKLNNVFPDFDVFLTTYKKHNERLWDQYREGTIKKDELRNQRFLLTLDEFGVKDEVLANQIGDDYVSISPTKTNLFPSTIEVLEYLKAKQYKMLIITNGFKEVQYVKLNNCGLKNYFHEVIVSEEVGFPKPKPEIFQKALSVVNAKKEESLMIGDDFQVDVMGAKGAGIDQVFFNPHNLKVNDQATYEISCLDQLKSFL